MSKLRYVLVLAALYGPCSFAADPVATVEANRKIMYGTAAVRPTPDTFDLASRGMCYVATDTGAITEWTGTVWINAATCGGGAGAVSTSPAYVTIVDSSGDSAVDATNNAVRVLTIASETSSEVTYSTTTGPDQTGTKSILNGGVDLAGATYCTVTILNTDDASNGTLDELDIYLLTNDETVAESWPMYDETQFASPPGALEVAQSGTPGGARDAAPDTTLDESDTWKLTIKTAGYATLDIYASASADDNAVDVDWTCN